MKKGFPKNNYSVGGPGYAIAQTPMACSQVKLSNPIIPWLNIIIVYFMLFLSPICLSLSEPLMESGNLCLMNQKKRQSSDWLSQRNFKDRWLKAWRLLSQTKPRFLRRCVLYSPCRRSNAAEHLKSLILPLS